MNPFCQSLDIEVPMYGENFPGKRVNHLDESTLIYSARLFEKKVDPFARAKS